MAYATLSDAQIDGDSPLIADTLFKLRDNPEAIALGLSGATRIQDAALDTGSATSAGQTWVNARIAAGSLGQGKLNTSMGEVSASNSSYTSLVLPGGEYGFYPQVRGSGTTGGASFNAQIASAVSHASYFTRISLQQNSGSLIVYAQQRYINSSPPYNLGDGDVPLFVFAIVDGNGDVVATYTADVPPWAYNGPTRVTADRIDHVTGKKYQRRCYLCRERGEVVRDEIEVTHEIKNADMSLIPHPFLGNDLAGKSIILLDPVETLDLLDLHEAGESISDLLTGKYLTVGNGDIRRACPQGVHPVAIRWKNSGKWRK